MVSIGGNMSIKAVLETTPAIRDRAKKVAKDQGCSAKQITSVIMERGLLEFEEGRLKLRKEVEAIPADEPQAEEGAA